MNTHIGSNRYQLFGKLIVQIILLLVLVLGFAALLRPHRNDLQILIPFVCILLLLNALIFVQLNYLPIGVVVNNEAKNICIKYLFLSTKQIDLADIISYSSTNIYTKSDSYDGVLICLKNGATILLSDFNLKDCAPVLTFLKENTVLFLWKEKFRFLSYYRRAIQG